MSCWDILGIGPTRDRDRIRQAYEGQMKFASEQEAKALEQAFLEATGEAPAQVTATSEPAEAGEKPSAGETEQSPRSSEKDEPLSAEDGQIVREVIIQVKALLNDDNRQKDEGIWKAILCEPPADQLPLRREIARQLEPQLRPMAENGSFPQPVAKFLGDWFDWFSVSEANQAPDPRLNPEPDGEPAADFDEETDQPPQMVNFWPAVIGWIVGLVVLAAIFGGMGGG
ncbi:MAG: J domain-containing protein [Alteromonadaceae bacterium]|nr:J domain-containing protein [Alteromonadaceae bacterium]